jgi:glucose/arabinose dehydrogenase
LQEIQCMKKPAVVKSSFFFICFFFLVFFSSAQTVIDSTNHLFNFDTVAKNLGYPWEILHGPDDSLWITEARGYRVVRISKNRTQAQKNIPPQQILKIPLGSSEVSFSRSIGTWPQGGMQGMVLHPEFLSGKPWVYLSYIYSGTCPSSPSSPCYFRTKIVRCRFYYANDAGNPSLRTPKQDSLVIMDTIIANLSGSNDHNSGRLAISPVKEINPGIDTTYKLYYTIGDMGAGQFNNSSRQLNAQNRDTCEGKILRLNTEPDGDGMPGTPIHDYDRYRQWIPDNNPFYHSVAAFSTLKTPIYSWGHRNAQGIVWGNVAGSWHLYSSEHGDRSDDEVNEIIDSVNYGWPRVAGMADNNYSNSDAYNNNDVLAGVPVTWNESTWATANNMKRPLFSFFNATAAQIHAINTGNIFTWPTVAPSSIDFYNGNIPGWKNSLLVTSLKYGMFRLKLNTTGSFVDSTSSTNIVDTFPLMHGWRVRDIAISPVANSGKFWVIIDSSGSTSGPTGGFGGSSNPTKDGGYVLMLTYKTPILLPLNLITFNGKLINGQTELNWKIEVDEKLGWLEIEKSTNRQNFITIGSVTNNIIRFVDKLPSIGNNYYRIKAVSVDGKVSYTNIINIVYQPSYFVMQVYPNPVKNELKLHLTSDKTCNIQLRIANGAGQNFYNTTVILKPGVNNFNLNVSTWPSQTYFVNVTSIDGKQHATKSFIKQ